MSHSDFSSSALARFNASVVKSPGCWLWSGGKFKSGYGQFYANGKTWRAHRASWIIHKGKIGELHVLHKCDNPLCVRPSHLFLGTHSDNMADMARKGRVVNNPLRGDKSPQAKLTEQQARAIKADTRRQSVIASEFGIHQVLVSRIKTGKAWVHI